MNGFKEVDFGLIDLIRMTRHVYPVNQGDARIIVERFKKSHGFDSPKVGANSLSNFIAFLGLFTRKILEVREGVVMRCTPGIPDDDEIFKILYEESKHIKTEI